MYCSRGPMARPGSRVRPGERPVDRPQGGLAGVASNPGRRWPGPTCRTRHAALCRYRPQAEGAALAVVQELLGHSNVRPLAATRDSGAGRRQPDRRRGRASTASPNAVPSWMTATIPAPEPLPYSKIDWRAADRAVTPVAGQSQAPLTCKTVGAARHAAESAARILPVRLRPDPLLAAREMVPGCIVD
jgi:hypothetical protein